MMLCNVFLHESVRSRDVFNPGEEQRFFALVMLMDPIAPKLSVFKKISYVAWGGDVDALLVDTIERANHAIVRECHFARDIDRFVCFGEVQAAAGEGDEREGCVGPRGWRHDGKFGQQCWILIRSNVLN